MLIADRCGHIVTSDRNIDQRQIAMSNCDVTLRHHIVTSSTTVPVDGRTNRTLSLPLTYCKPLSPSMVARLSGNGCISCRCSNDRESAGLSLAASATAGDLSAITA